MLELVLDYVPRRTTDALPVKLSLSPFLSLLSFSFCAHLKPELVNKQRKELSSLDSVLGSIWLDLPCRASLHCGSNTSRSSQLVTSRLHSIHLSRSQNNVFCALAHCTPVRNRVNEDRGRWRARERERSSHWVGTLFLGENCEESVENEIVTESARVAVECCVSYGVLAGQRRQDWLVVQWESKRRPKLAPSRLNELAKTVANCQSTGTSQAQQSRQHKQDFDLDLEIYCEQLLTSNLRVCCWSVAWKSFEHCELVNNKHIARVQWNN